MLAAHFWARVVTEHLRNIADHSCTIGFHRLTDAITGVALISHLRDDSVLLLRFHERASLPDIVRERFLGVDVDAALHRGHGRGKVSVVGRGNDHRIDVFVHLVEHHTEIFIKRLVFAPVLHVFRAVGGVHIAEGDEIFLAASLLIGLSGDPSARADEGDVELAVGGFARLANGEGGGCRASGQCAE